MKELYNKIEYVNLSIDVTKNEIEKLCKDAIEKNIYGVCVNPFYIRMVSDLLKDSKVKTISVVGYPLGQNTIESKIFEAHNAIKNGSNELEMAVNISRLKAGDVEYCIDEINAVKKICKKRILKIIIPWDILSIEEIELACQITIGSNADFITIINDSQKISLDKLKIVTELLGTEKGIKILSNGNNREIISLFKSDVDRVGLLELIK